MYSSDFELAIFFKFLGSDNNSTNIGFKHGDKVEIVRECLSAVSEYSFSEMNKVSSRNDENKLKDLINYGLFRVIKATFGSLANL